jgi:hypothetical protein
MDWSARFSWLAALRAPPELRFDETDRADMGTAFGLDASMEPEAPAAVAPSPGASAPPDAAAAWESRLIRRSGL